MKKYAPEKLVAASRYRNYFPTLPEEVRQDAYGRIGELIDEERAYCDKGNHGHMAQILASIALYEALQRHGADEAEAYRAVSEKTIQLSLPWERPGRSRRRPLRP